MASYCLVTMEWLIWCKCTLQLNEVASVVLCVLAVDSADGGVRDDGVQATWLYRGEGRCPRWWRKSGVELMPALCGAPEVLRGSAWSVMLLSLTFPTVVKKFSKEIYTLMFASHSREVISPKHFEVLVSIGLRGTRSSDLFVRLLVGSMTRHWGT